MSLITIHHRTRGRLKLGVIKNRVFLRTARESEHLFEKLDAWGIDARIFKAVISQRSDFFVVKDTQRRKYYRTLTSMYEKFGEYRHYIEDHDHRAQIFLPRIYFRVYDYDMRLIHEACPEALRFAKREPMEPTSPRAKREKHQALLRAAQGLF